MKKKAIRSKKLRSKKLRSKEPIIPLKLVAAAALLIVIGAYASGLVQRSNALQSTSPTPSGSANSTNAITFSVVENEYSINPGTLSVKAGDRVVLKVDNKGRIAHNLVIVGTGFSTPLIQPGSNATLEFTAPSSGNYTYLCSVSGHAAFGMQGMLNVLQSSQATLATNETGTVNQTYSTVLASLYPQGGFKTKIVLGDVVPRLVESGAMNLSKIEQLYRGNLTQQELDILTKPTYTPLTLNSSNANFYLLIFWALGISNNNRVLDNFSALSNSSGYGVANFASTGGWTLGTDSNAMTYFNRLHLVDLTPSQQNYVYDVTTHSYRPCCNNPTSFPDCNHGAALLALTELGASQGLNESQLFALDLQAQTLWFSTYYSLTALNLRYNNVSYWGSASKVLGINYSSATGWYKNVYQPLKNNNLLPPNPHGGVSCGV